MTILLYMSFKVQSIITLYWTYRVMGDVYGKGCQVIHVAYLAIIAMYALNVMEIERV